jgi:hypothetical protein
MSTKDVREFLRKQLAELADSDATPEEMALKIERAKATSQVASTYIAAVKVEIDGIRLADEIGVLPNSIEPGQAIERDQRVEPRVLSHPFRRSA